MARENILNMPLHGIHQARLIGRVWTLIYAKAMKLHYAINTDLKYDTIYVVQRLNEV